MSLEQLQEQLQVQVLALATIPIQLEEALMLLRLEQAQLAALVDIILGIKMNYLVMVTLGCHMIPAEVRLTLRD